MATLYCFDFDQTLFEGHLHNTLAQRAPLTRSREHLAQYGSTLLAEKGLRGGTFLWTLFAQILLASDELAVVTFSSFPDVIRGALNRGIAALQQTKGFEQQHRQRFHRLPIIYGGPAPSLYPNPPPPYSESIEERWLEGKVSYLERARRCYEARGVELEQIVLIDDDSENLRRAEESGYEVIFAPPYPAEASHLIALQNRVAKHS